MSQRVMQVRSPRVEAAGQALREALLLEDQSLPAVKGALGLLDEMERERASWPEYLVVVTPEEEA